MWYAKKGTRMNYRRTMAFLFGIAFAFGLFFSTWNVHAEGINEFQVDGVEELGEYTSTYWWLAKISHDSGVLTEFNIPIRSYNANRNIAIQVYYCDQDMYPDFGQMLGQSSVHNTVEGPYIWTQFNFTPAIQIQKGLCYAFVLVREPYDFSEEWLGEWIQTQNYVAFETQSQRSTDGILPGTLLYSYDLSGFIITNDGGIAITNSTQDIWNGLILFFIMCGGVIWFLELRIKKQRDQS